MNTSTDLPLNRHRERRRLAGSFLASSSRETSSRRDAGAPRRGTMGQRFKSQNCVRVVLTLAAIILATTSGLSQTTLSGRLLTPRFPGSTNTLPLTAILCFASLDGPGREPKPFRTWETEPVGWYRLTGAAGNYTLLFSTPAHFMRPILRHNIFTHPGEKLDRMNFSPQFDYADFHEGAWDNKAATDYFQTFVAQGRSVTQIGFRLAHDGVDGFGPKSQNLLVSIHRQGGGTPDQWEQVGPTLPVLNVDSGGGKNYIWSAGWNSGEVPLVPGSTYAVHLRAEIPGNTFQPFWRPSDDKSTDCYRVGAENTGFQGRKLWLAVSTDNDGLLIPYNKRVHKQFGPFAGFANKWSQTYVAQGRSLASVILYAAVGGAQPQLSRQRAVVRVRQGGPDGPVVGIEKLAIGNGTYTGDASWGTFGAAFAPGEVPLTPGQTYAVELQSIENYETLHGFVNIKGQVSDDRPGFNPYRKIAPDAYDQGDAFKNGTEKVDFDLDLQIIEYERAATNWPFATAETNLLRNGDMETEPGGIDAWKTFSLAGSTPPFRHTDAPEKTNHVARVLGGGKAGKPVDGGFVQRVDGLSHFETYRLSGRVRSSWAVDPEHQCYVGFDPTGQDENPMAETITWTTLPALHGHFVPHLSDAIRPATNAISIWLRGRTTSAADPEFKADFDDFALRRVRTGAP